MKNLLLITLILLMATWSVGQDLPQNPDPGKCYVRCVTPDVYKDVDVTIVKKPAYKKLVTHPAEYKTVTEKVMVKEASKKLIAHPAEYGYETVTYVKKEKANTLAAFPASFNPNTKTIEIKPKSANWIMGDKMPDCESADPNDCRVWCYKEIPAEFETYPIVDLNKDAYTEGTPINEVTATYRKQVVTKEAWIETIEIPAEYAEITRTVLVKDAWVETIEVPAETMTVKTEVLDKKGGLTVWKEVDCELVEYNPLPINWNLASYTLTEDAMKLIDTRLLPILKDNPEVMVEIASHTDSRGTAESNQVLSENRAQAVVTYLISKGINASRLVANGYGETRLLNRCSDGVSCTEREHLQNRRTEFRIIKQ